MGNHIIVVRVVGTTNEIREVANEMIAKLTAVYPCGVVYATLQHDGDAPEALTPKR